MISEAQRLSKWLRCLAASERRPTEGNYEQLIRFRRASHRKLSPNAQLVAYVHSLCKNCFLHLNFFRKKASVLPCIALYCSVGAGDGNRIHITGSRLSSHSANTLAQPANRKMPVSQMMSTSRMDQRRHDLTRPRMAQLI